MKSVEIKLNQQNGQNTIEYLLMMTVIIVVLLVVLGPQGKITTTVNNGIELSTKGVECMAENTCYEPPCEKVYTDCPAPAPAP